MVRAVIAGGLVREHGVALAEVARRVGVSTSAGSKIIKRRKSIVNPGNKVYILHGDHLQIIHHPAFGSSGVGLCPVYCMLIIPRLIVDGSTDAAVQALAAAAIKHSRLLGDFMDNSLRESRRTFKQTLSGKDWDLFSLILDQCSIDEILNFKWFQFTKLLAQINLFPCELPLCFRLSSICPNRLQSVFFASVSP